MNAAVIVAAGRGSRMGLDRNKVLYPLCGEPIVVRTARAFVDSGLFDGGVVIVTGENDMDEMRTMMDDAGVSVRAVVPGGADRQESVFCGIRACDENADIIAIHDGARCLVTCDIIENVLLKAYDTGAAAAAERAVDTVKYADSRGVIEKTIDRNYVWLMKTPQIFNANMYRAGVYAALKDKASVTDDCMLVERLGFKVHAVDCGHENIKLTYATDKIIAEAILTARENLSEK